MFKRVKNAALAALSPIVRENIKMNVRAKVKPDNVYITVYIEFAGIQIVEREIVV